MRKRPRLKADDKAKGKGRKEMIDQFARTQLLLGKEGMEALAGAKVAIFGIGGVGGYVAEALARSGVGSLAIVDDDKVCLTNINRQIIATRKTVGKYTFKSKLEELKNAE